MLFWCSVIRGGLIREVVGFAPYDYEKRITELLKVGKDKSVLKKAWSSQEGKEEERDEMANVLMKMRFVNICETLVIKNKNTAWWPAFQMLWHG
jgi:hypothetical protein